MSTFPLLDRSCDGRLERFRIVVERVERARQLDPVRRARRRVRLTREAEQRLRPQVPRCTSHAKSFI